VLGYAHIGSSPYQVGAQLNTYLTLGILYIWSALHLPAEQRRDANEGGQYPDGAYHHHGTHGGALLEIFDRLSDTPIAIERDETQVHNRGRAQKNVHGRVDVAPPDPEYPVAHQFVGQRERHDHQAQKEVGHGQRGDEPVLDVLQRLLRGDRDDDQHVTDDHHDHQHGDNDGGDDDLGEGVAAGIVRHGDGGVCDGDVAAGGVTAGPVQCRVVHHEEHVLDGDGRLGRHVGERHEAIWSLVTMYNTRLPEAARVGDNVKRNKI
jgi:hypothetical protein